jgi:hypothetical protein
MYCTEQGVETLLNWPPDRRMSSLWAVQLKSLPLESIFTRVSRVFESSQCLKWKVASKTKETLSLLPALLNHFPSYTNFFMCHSIFIINLYILYFKSDKGRTLARISHVQIENPKEFLEFAWNSLCIFWDTLYNISKSFGIQRVQFKGIPIESIPKSMTVPCVTLVSRRWQSHTPLNNH